MHVNDPKIIYENNNLIALNKPAGLLVHRAPGSGSEPTLVDWLLQHHPETASVGDNPSLRPGIIHRLDREASGIMLVARTQKAFEHLKNEFKNRRVNKRYIALVSGNPSKESGTINLPIARVGIKRVVGKPRNKAKDAKPAVTHWIIQRRFKNFTLLDIIPETGRTNQIRVHLAAINHPIACDPVYGGKAVRCPGSLNRLFLHAFSIEFTDHDGNKQALEAPLAEDLRQTLDNLDTQ